MRRTFFILALGLAHVLRASGADLAIEIDLTAQKAYLFHDGARIYVAPISSGRAGPLNFFPQAKITSCQVTRKP